MTSQTELTSEPTLITKECVTLPWLRKATASLVIARRSALASLYIVLVVMMSSCSCQDDVVMQQFNYINCSDRLVLAIDPGSALQFGMCCNMCGRAHHQSVLLQER